MRFNQAGALAYYLWDGMLLREERNSDGSLKARYTHGYSRLHGIGTEVEIQRNAGGATYYHYLATDLRGTTYSVTYVNQGTQLAYTMDAFGRMVAGIGGSNSVVPNDFIVQTNALTKQIGGIWYLLFKYRTVRIDEAVFLSKDFLRFSNKYRLWSNNPVGKIDWDGLESVDLNELREKLRCENEEIGGEEILKKYALIMETLKGFIKHGPPGAAIELSLELLGQKTGLPLSGGQLAEKFTSLIQGGPLQSLSRIDKTEAGYTFTLGTGRDQSQLGPYPASYQFPFTVPNPAEPFAQRQNVSVSAEELFDYFLALKKALEALEEAKDFRKQNERRRFLTIMDNKERENAENSCNARKQSQLRQAQFESYSKCISPAKPTLENQGLGTLDRLLKELAEEIIQNGLTYDDVFKSDSLQPIPLPNHVAPDATVNWADEKYAKHQQEFWKNVFQNVIGNSK